MSTKNKKFKKALTLGFSPCPNDCFIFDALLHQKIDTEGLHFKPVIEDVEALNRKAFTPSQSKQLDITKLSFFAFTQLQKKYALLDSGSALGFGVGPLVVTTSNTKPLTSHSTVAIPGKYTTANLLFSLAYPAVENKKELLFSKIEDAVLKEKVDAGVIIHESRFTYKEKGLKKIIDLGDWWEKKTKSPIPLGCIAIKNTFDAETQKKANRVIKRSVEFAFAHPNSSKEFIKEHSQELDDDVIKKHIRLYVNKFSISLGKQGNKAINIFLKHAKETFEQ